MYTAAFILHNSSNRVKRADRKATFEANILFSLSKYLKWSTVFIYYSFQIQNNKE